MTTYNKTWHRLTTTDTYSWYTTTPDQSLGDPTPTWILKSLLRLLCIFVICFTPWSNFKLYEFVQKIKDNYNQNLRDNKIKIDF